MRMSDWSSDVCSSDLRKSRVVLPGFFRATKNWDVLVIHERRLLGVFEFKSQVGSIINNFNNRSEEVIGLAADLWVAHHHGAYSEARKSVVCGRGVSVRVDLGSRRFMKKKKKRK